VIPKDSPLWKKAHSTIQTMYKRIKVFVIFIFLFQLISFSCNERDCRHDLINIQSGDSTIRVKISYPEKWINKDKIIVWSTSPISNNFISDSIVINKFLSMDPILRRALLDSGYVNIEYIGRKDSITYNNRIYSNIDARTKANDLNNLLNYLHTEKQLKDKKIILVGHSEGGEINAMVASRNKDNICAMVQLASPSVSGKETVEYQREQFGYRDFLFSSGKGIQTLMDKSANIMSSLDSYHKASIDGVKQFFKENIEPLEDFIYRFDTMDSIYYHIDLYLRERWENEDNETKEKYKNNFENYYEIFAHVFTPHQITLRKFDPEKYYPFIKCPVLAVQGTEDERVDCYPNIENMDRLLKSGGNLYFEKMILEGYHHNLAKGDEGNQYLELEGQWVSVQSKSNLSVDDDVINRIVKWIDKK